jgi:hypothetical protein
MAEKTFEQIKAIYLGNPEFTQEGYRLYAIPLGRGIFELDEKKEQYYRENGFSLFTYSASNDTWQFAVDDNDGKSYSVRANDAELSERYRQNQRTIFQIQRTGQVPNPESGLNTEQPPPPTESGTSTGSGGLTTEQQAELDQAKQNVRGALATPPPTPEEPVPVVPDKPVKPTPPSASPVSSDTELTFDVEEAKTIVSGKIVRSGSTATLSFVDQYGATLTSLYKIERDKWSAQELENAINGSNGLMKDLLRQYGASDLTEDTLESTGIEFTSENIATQMGAVAFQQVGEGQSVMSVIPFNDIPDVGESSAEIDPNASPVSEGEIVTGADPVTGEVTTRRQGATGVAAEGADTSAEDTVARDVPDNVGVGFPDLPRNDADVARFTQEMKQRGLLHGLGTVTGIPTDPSDESSVGPIEPDTETEPTADLSLVSTTGDIGPADSVVQDKVKSTPEVPKAPSRVTSNSQPAVMDGGGGNGLPLDQRPAGEGTNHGGLDRPLTEPVPFFQKCSADKVLFGKNNTWMVFGRDRPGGLNSGYGPGGQQTQAGAIDICVGRMSPRPLSFDSRGRKIKVGPIFTKESYSYDDGETLSVMDAARIYISQKTDLDENFELQVPKKTNPSRAVSGIALKADGIRIMSRKAGIRLVTEDANSISSRGGSDSSEPLGICLIAANKAKELQPIPKGDNLTLLLIEMLQNQTEIAGAIASIKSDLISLNAALLAHEHVNAVTGPTIKLPGLMIETTRGMVKLIAQDTPTAFALQQNPEVLEKTYLVDGAKSCIKSKYNKVN